MMKEELNEIKICNEYQHTNIGVEALAGKYHVGKKKILDIFKRHNIVTKKRGGQKSKETFVVEDWKIEKYPALEGKHYLVYDENTDFITKDIKNNGGTLTTYIKQQYGVEIPTLWKRQTYYMRTGNYWWEQWLKVKLVNDKDVKKCPYCDWETTDITNSSGAFEIHLHKCHGLTKIEYLKEHPEERDYFRLVSCRLDREMETDTDKFVICKVCGAHLARIDTHHLKIHNMTKQDYIRKFGATGLSSKEYHEKQSKLSKIANQNIKYTFHSHDEKEIIDFLKDKGIECHTDRSILQGKELDIYIPSKKIAIEYNGNKWHTEFFGHKNANYHLGKLEDCHRQGVKLIQIFEDEYQFHREIVLSKIEHILDLGNDKPKIYGRKCVIHPITKDLAKPFLEKNHLQGFASATVYLGAYFQNQIIGVMTLVQESEGMWNLNRCATSNDYVCVGVCGKMFKYFTTHHEFEEVKSFADRRWTIDATDNLYIRLGFDLGSVIKPSYTYYNTSVNRYKRFHKFAFRKQILHEKYGLPLSMTETEMIKELGYDRIWDCGLIKYVYKNRNR